MTGSKLTYSPVSLGLGFSNSYLNQPLYFRVLLHTTAAQTAQGGHHNLKHFRAPNVRTVVVSPEPVESIIHLSGADKARMCNEACIDDSRHHPQYVL